MNLERMLELCRKGQWDADDLDWSVEPRLFDREDEVAIVQFFTDMAGIELLAGALFEVQRDRTEDPTLRAIFDSFVEDEKRHSIVALRLADHYDVHRYQRYSENAHLSRFREHFVRMLRYLSPEIANAYITTGELLLDIALLRSLDDYVDDTMSHSAMALINRDESRHIAVDYHMVEYYASEEYALLEASRSRPPLLSRLRGMLAMVAFIYHAGPFFKAVFFEPMDMVDPSGRRLREAFKRAQLLGEKPEIASRPFPRFTRAMQQTFMHPVLGPILGPLARRALGVDARVIAPLYTDEEAERARRMSIEELGREALGAKLAF